MVTVPWQWADMSTKSRALGSYYILVVMHRFHFSSFQGLPHAPTSSAPLTFTPSQTPPPCTEMCTSFFSLPASQHPHLTPHTPRTKQNVWTCKYCSSRQWTASREGGVRSGPQHGLSQLWSSRGCDANMLSPAKEWLGSMSTWRALLQTPATAPIGA